MRHVLRRLTADDDLQVATPNYLFYPPAGGGSGNFQCLASMRSDIEAWAVEYPGRASRLRERPAESLRVLADETAAALLEQWSAAKLRRGVYAGFSMGAFVALEVARILEGQGVGPAALMVIGATAPQRRRRLGGTGLTDDEVLKALYEQGRPLPTELSANEEARRYAIDLLRHDMRLIGSHAVEWRHSLSCTIAAVCGEADPRFVDDDATWAWRTWTRGPFAARVVPGGHLGLLDGLSGSEEFWRCARQLVESNLETSAGPGRGARP